MILFAQVFDAPNCRMSGRKVADDALRKRMVSGYKTSIREAAGLMAVGGSVCDRNDFVSFFARSLRGCSTPSLCVWLVAHNVESLY